MEVKRLQLVWCRLHAGLIVATIQVCSDREPSLRAGGPDESQDLAVAVEGLARPVLGNLGEETMLDGIPLGRTGGIVRDGESEAEPIDELRLQFGLPGPASIAIAAARVAEQEHAACPAIPDTAIVLPPARDGAGGEGGRIVRDADGHAPAVGEEIVNPVRNGHADRVGAEVVIVDQTRRAIPARAWVLEVANQLALLRTIERLR